MVVPGDSEVTTPAAFIVATAMVDDDQLPPLTVLDKVVVLPTQIEVVPVMVPAVAVLIVIAATAAAVPQPVVTL
jgi:hypothetical protein